MLRGADAADVAAYQASQQKRRRQSVAVRLDSWRQQRMQEAVQEQRRAVEAQEVRHCHRHPHSPSLTAYPITDNSTTPVTNTQHYTPFTTPPYHRTTVPLYHCTNAPLHY